MLGNFFRSLFKKTTSVKKFLAHPEGKRIYRQQHGIRREQMDPDALKVVHRLNQHGYRAYFVGGCVRDMLLKKRPKDFDVATSATPPQIRRIFSNSRSVGRRFRIVHILFRYEKVIEVSTFRSLPHHRFQKKKERSYFIRRDNRFGSPQEDAARRDFTVNGLYFDLRNESIIDYVGGFRDIQKKCLRSVSDPNISFQEDPVRMLRACKFASLLNFQLENKTASAIRRYAKEIKKSNRSRLLDEIMKIFRTGDTAKIFSVLYDLDLLRHLFPRVYSASYMNEASFTDTSMGKRIEIADKNLAEREELTTTIYLSLILADLVKDLFHKPTMPNQANYVRKGITGICRQMQLSNRDQDRLFHIYMSHSRFLNTPEEKSAKPDLFRKKIFFYEAFMFFKIYSISEDNEENIQKAMFWEIGPRMAPPERYTAISTFLKRSGTQKFQSHRDSRRHSYKSSSRNPRRSSRSGPNSSSSSSSRSRSRPNSRSRSPSQGRGHSSGPSP